MIVINLSPNCENNLGLDGVSSPNSCLLIKILQLVLHSTKSNNLVTIMEQIKLNFKLNLKTIHIIIVFGGFHSHKIKCIKINERHKQI